MMVIVILGILAAISIPTYYSTIENSREAEAKNNLNIIYMAQKIHKLNNGTYWSPGHANTMSEETDIPNMNDKLNIDIPPPQYFELSIAVVGDDPSASAYDFIITARRKESDRALRITKTGRIESADITQDEEPPA